MNSKASAILEKASEERRRSSFKKAIDRLEEGVEKFPGEFALYTEAIDVGMEAGESLRAIQIFKKAQHKFPDQRFEVWTFAAEKVGSYNDSIMGRFLIEQAVKTGDLAAAASILENLKDHAVSDLLERIRIKKQTMTVARGAGSAGRGEIASFTLTEALLSLRLGRIPAAMDGFVAALEEDPAAAKKTEAFLSDFESRGEGKAETSFALGCCLLSRADYEQGLAKLSQAARGAPALAPRVIERIESLADAPDLPLDFHDLTLAQLYLAQGEKTRAARILKGTIERTPRRAADTVDLLRGTVETIDEDLETQFVFIEAAFTAGRRETALGQLRKIHKDKRHSARLVEWLGSRTQSQAGSTEVQLFFAETALDEGLFGKSIDIFKDILSRGTNEEAIIRDLLSRHQSVPVVRAFYKDRFAASREKEKTSDFELERYESQGLRPRETAFAADGGPSTNGGISADGAAPAPVESFQTVESLFHQAAAAQRAKGEAPAVDFENHDFSLAMHEPGARPEAVDALEVSGGPPAAQTPTREAAAAEAAPAAQRAAAQPRDETSFAGVASALDSAPAKAAPRSEASFANIAPAAGAPAPDTATAASAPASPGDTQASDFFEYLQRHTESAAAEPPREPEPKNEPREAPAAEAPSTLEATAGADAPAIFDEAPAAENTGEPERLEDPKEAAAPETPEEEDYSDFDSLYRAYVDGRLDHARTIEAAGRAFEECRMDEMKRLLSFEPANLGEDIARKYHLARYYIEEERPLSALVALRTVNLNSLGRDERKDFLLRIAECYAALHNFGAAHGVYLRVMTEHPGLPEAETLARANYARYIDTAAGAAAALEKTTTL